jgi:hypothetical protein
MEKWQIFSRNQRRRDIIGLARLLFVISLLVASVLGAQYLFGFSSGAAIVAGGVFAYAVSTIAVRRVLPKPPTWTDEERVCLTPNMRRWLVAGIFGIVMIHFGGTLPWGLTLVLVSVSIGCLVVRELHLRNQAQRRLHTCQQWNQGK